MVETEMRKLGPIRAALLNLIGPGLGYVYVGRIELALVLIAGTVILIAVAGWSGLVFTPTALYGLALVAAFLGLSIMVHGAVIAARHRTTKRRPYNVWWFYLLWIVGAWFSGEVIIWARPVLFGFEPLHLPSASMAPTLRQGDFIMADTWYYDQNDPAFGDLVVFRVPDSRGTKYVKRIIGLPGDLIEIRDDVLVRNRQEIEEPYIQLSMHRSRQGSDFGPMTVPNASFFVLGDNRHNSLDSRHFGPIDRSSLQGRVVHRWFAFDGSVSWGRFPQRLESNAQP